MAYARMYESLGPLYLGNLPTTPQGSANDPNPIAEGSSHRHPAPGHLGGGSASSGGTRRKLSDDDNDLGDSKNTSGSYRRRPLGAGASTRGSGDDESSIGKRRPGSPIPLPPTRDPSKRSPRLATPSSKSYDSTDNMRLNGHDKSSSESSDAARYRPTTRSGLSSRRRQDIDSKGAPDTSPSTAGPRSTWRDGDLPLRRRPDLGRRGSDNDSPPGRSLDRDEIPLRRRKAADSEFERNRSSPRASLKLDLSDDLPVRRRREADSNNESPPLQSTYRRDQFGPGTDLTRRGARDESPPHLRSHYRDDLPLHRRKDLDESEPLESEGMPQRRRKDRVSSPPLRSTSREDYLPQRRLDLADPDDRYSRAKRLSPRPGLRDNLSRRGKEPDDNSDSPLGPDELPLHRRRDHAARNDRGATSPPLRSTSRDDIPVTRRKSLYTDGQLSPRARSTTRDSLSLSPGRQQDRSSKQDGRDPSPTRSGYRPGQLRKGMDEAGDTRGARSTRGDKEQPKFGVLKRAGSSESTTRRKNIPEKKKSSDSDSSSSSSSDSSDKRGSRRGADRPPIRLTPDRRSSTGGKYAGKSQRDDVRPRPGKEETETERRERSLSFTRNTAGSRSRMNADGKGDTDTYSKSKKEKLVEPKAPLSRKKDLSQDRDNSLSKRTVARDDRLSPRRSGIPDEKVSSLRTTARKTSQDDFSVGRQMKAGRDTSPPRTASLRPGSRNTQHLSPGREKTLASPRTPLREGRGSSFDEDRDFKRENRSTRALDSGGKRDDFSFRKRLGLHDQEYFDFTICDKKLRLVKLKRHLPVNLSGTRYDLVLQAARHIGFIKSSDDDFKTPLIIWTDSFISAERLAQLKSFQRVNHFPGMIELARKDLLAKNLGKLAKLHPSEYNFAPQTWCLPGEFSQFQQYVKEASKAEKKQKSFICKPIDGAAGRGIKIYKTAEEVPQAIEEECVLQEYVPNPFLIDNVKFDMRLYVLITSCDPLRVYFYNDGFVQMSTEPYVEPLKCTPKDDMTLMHLTNSSVNRLNQPAESAASARLSGFRSGTRGGSNKRPLRFLNEYLQKGKYDVALVWRKIIDLILKTVFAAYPHLVRSYRQCRPMDGPSSASVCFEILGFDVLLDANLRPWLLEVNRSPSFDSNLTTERDTKLELLEETLMLLNVSQSDRRRSANAGAPKLEAYSGAASSSKEQRELADLMALQARLRRQNQLSETDARVCQRFRRIFPADEPARQEKLVSLLLDAFPALLGASAGPVQRELEAFYSSKLSIEEVTKQVAQRSSTTVEQLAAESDNSSSGDEDREDRLKRLGRRGTIRQALAAARSKSPAEKLADETKRKKQLKQKQKQQQQLQAEAAKSSEYERLASQALKFLNQLSIRFPGKSGREAERMLRDLQTNWKARRDDVSGYWRLSLDADKRRKVLDIARHNVRVALDKAFRGAGAAALDGAAEASPTRRLNRLFEKLYNRLLWCHGQGLWDTFSGRATWEGILRQSWEAPTETEINCCRRVVQLCQDCLLVVFLYSDAADQQTQQQQQQQQQQPVTVS